MKILLLAVATLSLVAVYTGTAPAYDPYSYDPYDPYNVSVQYVPPYDPYYELHQIHYQLYLRPYSLYPYPFPYYVPRPASVVVIGAPVVGTPARGLRAAQPAARKR